MASAAPPPEADFGLRARAAERAKALPPPVGVALTGFYAERDQRPAWRREASFWRGPGPLREVGALIATLREAERFGLDPADYAPDSLARRVEETDWSAAAEVAELDVALSGAFLVFARHLARGRLDPGRIGIEWHTEVPEPDLAGWLEAVFARGLDTVVEEAQPPHVEYRRLREELARYREIAQSGGWPRVERADDERALRTRLGAEGVNARQLEPAIRAFQERHGLAADGVVGPETLAALNVPAEARAEQIALNLERWRWVPRELGETHVEVNIPAFGLELREGGRTALAMPVVVGKVGRATPMMSDQIESIVLNPYWNVPRSITVEEVLPEIEKDPDHLDKMDFEVVRGFGEEAQVVDPDDVDWDELADEESELRIRQRPGPGNALGRIKFLLPNHLDIYLHDTPAEQLFEETERGFSHGCIRLARPVELAEQLLAGAGQWDGATLREAIAGEERVEIGLAEPVPVHLFYWTALPRPEGGVAFYEDVYGIDEKQRGALGS